MSKVDILKMLPKFEERYLAPIVSKWGRQWALVDRNKEVLRTKEGKPIVNFKDFRREGKLFKRKHLEEHFGARPSYGEVYYKPWNKNVPCVFGSFGIALRFTEGLVKSLCLDADNEHYMNLLHQKVMPWLDEREIDYIYEYSGYDNDRAHLWIPTEGMNIRYTNLFFEQVMRDSGANNIKEWFDEQYPYGKREDSLIRLPFGLHTKLMDVFLGEFNGKPFKDVEEGLEAMCYKATLLTQEKLESFLTEAPKERKVYVEPTKLILNDAFEMPPPMELPEVPRRLSSKCLAIHKLIEDVINENKLINKKGGLYHNAGLCLSGIFQKHDDIYKGTEGRDAFQKLVQENRNRSAEDHNWEYYWGSKSGQVWRCETMDKTFGNCDGCIYKDRIRNPIQLLKAESLIKNKVGQVRVAPLDQIRAEVFPQMEEMVYGALKNNKILDLVVESVQESGKSVAADKLAAKLALEGKKVAIACNSINVALEHKERVEGAGAKAFIMTSYESGFERDEISGGLVCPNEQEIKDCRSLGVPSSYYKKKYCKSCPFNDECFFPNQYKQVQEEKYKVVIIQHAHFSCEETTRQLFKKQFDVLIIDENFNDHLINQIIPSQKEIDLLQEFEDKYDWIYPLTKWMVRGGKPSQVIDPQKKDLAPIKARFAEEKEPYRLPDFLRCYRAGDWFDTEVGIMKFIPVPECQVRLILDATATLKELKIILNNPDIKTIGGGLVAEPRAYHKDNEVIQILNGSASKSSMVGKEKLYEWLEFIGDTMMAPGNEDKTCLITTFKEFIDPVTKEKSYPEQDAIDWLDRNYPKIIPRIAINRMAVGTNKWAHFNYQFILANVYLTAKQMKMEVYKLKFIENYWRKVNGDPQIRNPYPGDLSDKLGESRSTAWVPFKYIDEKGIIWECPQYKYKRPINDFYESCVFERKLSRKQQSERIRQMKPGKLTKVFVCDREPLLSRAVTRIAEEDEFLAQYRE